MSSGVPQGTILGPILFNVYVRHLPHVASSFGCELPMFADDMTLYATSPSPSMATQVLTCALHALHTHLSELGLNVNMEKSSVMFVSKHPSPQLPPVTIGTSNLQVTHQARCLGVIITDNLSWSPHVDAILSKVCQKIGVLRRCFRQLSVRARRMYLLCVILPDIEYALASFVTHLSAGDRSRLSAVYRRAVRAASGANRQDDITPLLAGLCIQPFELRIVSLFANFVFKCKIHQSSARCSLFPQHV